MTLLIDSNVIIYAVQAQFCDLRRWIIDNDPQYSIISRVEVLGYAGLQSVERQAITELLDNLEIVYLSPNCYELAIALKQQRKMSLGDALIAATCLEHRKIIATRNIADFNWIDNLEVINPLLIAQ
jgi:predicted nucleic acid-binding protein